ncbi:MAG TPA: phosphoribosylanthranilate isomerase, partial [Candidatus Brocadiales bacterium]|nr:phosphoribosylanthranilate isomerase [Candidatus Brocadiales bacterium]
MVKVKICGITNAEDAMDAVALGADALGFIFADSPRKITEIEARAIIKSLPPFISCVGLFVNESIERVRDVCEFCSLHAVQLHGDEPPEYLFGL